MADKIVSVELSTPQRSTVYVALKLYLDSRLRARNKEVSGSRMHEALSADIKAVQATLDLFT